MKIAFLTLGCKVNQSESSLLEGTAEKMGHRIVGLSERPDICVINTCSVTAKSDYQSRQLIRRAGRAGSRVIVTGCYSELNMEQVALMEGVTAVVHNQDKLAVILEKISGPFSANLPLSMSMRRSRFFLKVQDGCNSSCSYCIIPKARGKSVSISPNAIINQITGAAMLGYNEVILTGINLGLYGYDLKPKVLLHDLIGLIINMTRISRIRLSSIELSEISENLMDIMLNIRLCRHIHIPLQSGDDNILNLMNRNYTSVEFSERIMSITDSIPDMAIGTDVIAGFPGEGDREFDNTLRVLKDLPLSYIHVFPFSPRPGSAAAEMDYQVSESVKKERCAVITELNRVKRLEYMRKQVGKTLSVVIEDCKPDGTSTGISSNYQHVRIDSSCLARRTLANIRIEGVRDMQLTGKPLS